MNTIKQLHCKTCTAKINYMITINVSFQVNEMYGFKCGYSCFFIILQTANAQKDVEFGADHSTDFVSEQKVSYCIKRQT